MHRARRKGDLPQPSPGPSQQPTHQGMQDSFLCLLPDWCDVVSAALALVYIVIPVRESSCVAGTEATLWLEIRFCTSVRLDFLASSTGLPLPTVFQTVV